VTPDPAAPPLALLDRFRGSLLGTALGEQIGSQQWASAAAAPSVWQQIALATARYLSSRGDWSADGLCAELQQAQPALLRSRGCARPGEAALATLPIALFFHDDWALARARLQDGACLWQQPGEPSEEVLAWGIAIARELAASAPGGASSENATSSLAMATDAALALAWECYQLTPTAARLCVARAARAREREALAAALAGALAGSHSGWSGMPIAWRVALRHAPHFPALEAAASQLLAGWSGAAAPGEALARAAVAAPGGLRSG